MSQKRRSRLQRTLAKQSIRVTPAESNHHPISPGRIMRFTARYVEASENGDFLQVLFEERRDDDSVYFLIQRAFDFDAEEDEPDPWYVESHDERLCGNLDIAKAVLDRGKFSLGTACVDKPDVEILFNITDKDFFEVRRLMGIILGMTTNFRTE